MSDMGNEYTAIAALYDGFRGESPNMWAAYLDELFGRFACKKPKTVLDLCCGTGTVTAALCRLGYDMIGIDRSEEMLALAREHAPSALLLHQDMRSIDLYGTVDAVVCCLDSINYLPEYGDVCRTFDSVNRFLNPCGLFIFDVNTKKRFAEKYGKNDFILENKNGLIAWSCDYKPRLGRCDFYLSCFIPGADGRYTRRDEEQSEYCYSDGQLRAAAESGGFEVLAAYDRMALHDADENSEKVHYILRKRDTEKDK